MPPGAGFSQDERAVSATKQMEDNEPTAAASSSSSSTASSSSWGVNAEGGMEITVAADVKQQQQQQQQRSKENNNPNPCSGSVDGQQQQPKDGAPAATEGFSGRGGTEMVAEGAGGMQKDKKKVSDDEEASIISMVSSDDSAVAQEGATALDAVTADRCQDLVAVLEQNKTTEPEQQLQACNGKVATSSNKNISDYDKFQKEVESWSGTLPENYQGGANGDPKSNDNSNNDSDATAMSSFTISDLCDLLQSDATVDGPLEDFRAGVDRASRAYGKHQRAREAYVRSNKDTPLALEACFRSSIKYKAMVSHLAALGAETRDQLFPPVRFEDGDGDAMVESVSSRSGRLATFLEEASTIKKTETFHSFSVAEWLE